VNLNRTGLKYIIKSKRKQHHPLSIDRFSYEIPMTQQRDSSENERVVNKLVSNRIVHYILHRIDHHETRSEAA
jgi:hypothetical protein